MLVLWLVNLVAGLVMAPFALVGSLRFITQLWVLVPLAVVYAALIAYWGVVLAGLVMSLYLAGRPPAERVGTEEPVVAAHNPKLCTYSAEALIRHERRWGKQQERREVNHGDGPR